MQIHVFFVSVLDTIEKDTILNLLRELKRQDLILMEWTDGFEDEAWNGAVVLSDCDSVAFAGIS